MINKKYVPKYLSKKDKKKQIKSIKSGSTKPRPKLKSAKPKRSKHVIKFEKKYGKKITDLDFIYKNIIKKKGVDLIFKKAIAAYTTGSRPQTNINSWKFARLASVITGGNARKYDKEIWDKYKISKKTVNKSKKN